VNTGAKPQLFTTATLTASAGAHTASKMTTIAKIFKFLFIIFPPSLTIVNISRHTCLILDANSFKNYANEAYNNRIFLSPSL
jgi:hypothetical protein